MFSRFAEDLLYFWPSIKWVTECPLSSLKVEIVLGASLLNHTLASPLIVVGNALHMISSGTPCRCIRALKDFRWSNESREPSYASLEAFGTWLEGGKKSLVLWRVSRFARLVYPGWWIPIPSKRSSSCPSFLSSSAYPMPCASRCSPILTDGWCHSAYPACWGYCFPLGLPFPSDLPLGDDCYFFLRCSTHHMLILGVSFVPLVQLLF